MPLRVVDAQAMRAADAYTINKLEIPALTLMDRAGEGLAFAVRERFETPRGQRVVVVCGRGSNGGDGFVAARHLAAGGSRVTVLLLGQARELTGAARTQWTRLAKVAKTKLTRREVPDEAAFGRCQSILESADLVVDAMLGTGASGPLRGAIAAACQALQTLGAPIVAADLPTGVDATTGDCQRFAVRATLTVTFAFPKLGNFLLPGREHSGQLEVVDIGIPETALPPSTRRIEVLTPADCAELLPPRPGGAHKGTLGRVRVIGGSPGMLGALALASRAALRSGAGLCSVGLSASLYPAAAALLLESTAILLADERGYLMASAMEDALADLSGRSALAVGPGLSTLEPAPALARQLYANATVPLVLDADGLNAFRDDTELLARHEGPRVLTPHVGEFARLTGLDAAQVEEQRLTLPSGCAREWDAVIVLKGSPTAIAAPDGRLRLNPTGNAGMATGGAGDVLTGMIAAFLARGLDPFDAASLAVYLHGLAGDFARAAVGEESLIASDLLHHLPQAFQEIRPV